MQMGKHSRCQSDLYVSPFCRVQVIVDLEHEVLSGSAAAGLRRPAHQPVPVVKAVQLASHGGNEIEMELHKRCRIWDHRPATLLAEHAKCVAAATRRVLPSVCGVQAARQIFWRLQPQASRQHLEQT